MIKFEQYLLESNGYNWKKDLKNPTYDDGSQTTNEHGTKIWLNDKGQLHREDDKPAMIYPDGNMGWWINDKSHREDDKPAWIQSDGSMSWFINGRRNRENDKPARITSDGYREWYINGNDKEIEPKLKHMIAAIEDDPSFAEHEQFIDFIKQQKNILIKDQERMLKVDPRLAEYISNLDPKFKKTRQAASFGMFDL